MPDQERGKPLPAGFKAAIFALLLLWIAALVVLSRTHRTPRLQTQAQLPVYPSALEFSASSVPDRDWSTATYYVELDYPSPEVLHYYDDEMTRQRWSREGAPDLPQWQVFGGKNGRQASLVAAWISPDQLMRVDLRLQWQEPDRAKPGSEAEHRMRVTATMSRTVLPPGLAAPARPRSEQPQDKGQTPFAR